MSSWMSLSPPNPFKSEEEDHQDQNPTTPPTVKEDLSVLGQTIGRQLRGVADFFAPPPPSSAPAPAEDTSTETFLGIKKDLVEIGGSFKTSLSLLSSNKAVTEISRFATNLLQFGGEEEEEEEEDEDAVGITEEVVEFVLKISNMPELWTDFPLTLRNDIDMSDVQREHAVTIEDLVPSLAALKHEICNYLNEEQFWMVYFILLLPRLNENDSKLLSTPEIVEAREILLQKLQNKNNAPVKTSEVSEKLQKKNNAPVETSEASEKMQKKNNAPVETSVASETVKTFQEGGKDNSTEANKSPSHGNEVPTEMVNAAKGSEIGYHVNTKWFKERGVDTCTSGDAQKQSEDDLSFSDLEDDDNDLLGKRPGFRREEIKRVPSCSESNEWVQLNENMGTLGGQHKAVQSNSGERDSESGESYDWLTIDDTDLDRSASA